MLAANLREPITESPKAHIGVNPRPSPLTQALNIRDALYQRLQTEELCPADHAKLARAWNEACQLVREIQGHGKPRPVTARNDPDSAKAKARARKAVEPQPLPE